VVAERNSSKEGCRETDTKPKEGKGEREKENGDAKERLGALLRNYPGTKTY